MTDGGGAPAFTTVDITILDANDNAPLFEQESFQVSLMENLTVGSTVFEMKASCTLFVINSFESIADDVIEVIIVPTPLVGGGTIYSNGFFFVP